VKRQPHRNGVHHLRPAAPSAAQQALTRGLSHHQAGRLVEAEATYRQVLAAEPANPTALHLLGALANQLGQHGAAIELISQAVAIEPLAASAHSNLGVAYQSVGRLEEAVGSYGRALALQPDHVDALNNRGIALQALGRPIEALESFEGSLRLRPNHPETLNNAGVLLYSLGRLDEAELRLRRSLKLRPGYPDALSNLASVLVARHQPDEALRLAQQAVALAPGDSRFHDTLGAIFRAVGRNDDSIRSHQRALSLSPDVAGTWLNLAGTLQVAGRLDEAVAAYRRVLELDPTSAIAHSGLIFMLDVLPDAVDEAYAERRRWSARFGQRWLTEPLAHTNAPDPERRLRVGYVSADFRQHSAAYAILPILREHDRSQVEIVCYSSVTMRDDITAQFERLADGWREIVGLSDDDLAAQIQADQIDILVDLSGHSAGNRLPVFGRKPAPVQVTAWGYASGTGLAAIDAFLADAVILPKDERHHFAETVIDLPCALCFEPPHEAPAVGPLPALDRGVVTFGSFHRRTRLTDEALDLWARTVAAVPNARMLLKSPDLDEPATRERIEAAFAQHGVGADRLTILGATSRLDHLATYQQVDIHLDSCPQGGGITAIEGLAMGVPIVTLFGEGITGRTASSFLTVLGRPDLIARTPDEYISIACRLAGDAPALTQERATLRERLLASPVGNARLYTQHVEDTYRALWRRWCGEESELVLSAAKEDGRQESGEGSIQGEPRP
jgi:predicted O-linked N-acetylglucosamine transferase (SPINDLY family)